LILDEKTEEQKIRDASLHLRKRERFLSSRYDFESKFTYWDADELRLSIIDHPVVFKRPDGLDVVVTGDLHWKHPDKITVYPDQLVELLHADKTHINAIMMTYKEFGKIELVGLQMPGLEKMKSYCQKLDFEIVDVAKRLKAEKIKMGFSKILNEMGVETGSPHDRLMNRLLYYKKVADFYSKDKVLWKPEMKRLGLL
jgi:hypothetical protein